MDLQNNHPNPMYALVSIISTLLAWTFKDLQIVLGIFASIVAIISGIMAIKYYWTAIEKMKNSNK